MICEMFLSSGVENDSVAAAIAVEIIWVFGFSLKTVKRKAVSVADA